MIDKLVELGQSLREKGSHDAVKKEPVFMDIIINKKGEFIEFIELLENSTTLCEAIIGSKKGKGRLLVDKVEETLNFDVKKHKLYIDKLNLYKNIDILKPVFSFYDESNKNGLKKAKQKYEKEYKDKHDKLNSTMHYAFRILNDDKNLNEYKEVLDEIKKRYDDNQLKNKTEQICSICGKSDYPITDTPHGYIKQVPNGQPLGCVFISYNENAFESYNLSGNLNSSICERCAKNYTSGLNELLSNHCVVKSEKGKDYKNYKYRKSLGSDAAMLFWLRNGNVIKATEFIEDTKVIEDDTEWIENASKAQSNVEDFHIILKSIFEKNDKDYKKIDEQDFYSMIISGEASRIHLRSWIETTGGEVKENITKWFYDIALYNSFDKKVDIFTMYHLVDGVSKDSYIAKKVYEYLYNAALFDKPIPIYVLGEVIKSVHSSIYKSKYIKNENVALLKLILNRLNTKKGGFDMKAKLDETNENIAYIAGRIFALYEQVQYAALGDVNAGIRERYFTSASTTPARAFGRLANMSQKHITKLEKSGSVYYDKELQKLFAKIDGQSGFPNLFSLEQQGQFVIGYYHQKQEIYTKKSIKKLMIKIMIVSKY